MRIVMFTDAYWPRVNGVTVSVDSFSGALVRAGHDVLIVAAFYPEGNPGADKTLLDAELPAVEKTEENAPKIVRVPSMPAFVTKEDRLAKLHKWFWVFKQVELFAPDIIHVNTEMIIAKFGFLYARSHNLPAVYTFHTMWEDYTPHYFPWFHSGFVKLVTRRILKNVLRQSYRVIVPTPQIEEVVLRYRPQAKTFLLPTGIENRLFEHSAEETAAFRKKLEGHFPALAGKRIILFAGRVVKEKNIGFLLDILPAILAKFPDVVLLVAGDGPDLEGYKKGAKEAGIDAACVFTGYLKRKDMALAYTIAEVFVFPSLTDTQGLVTLESMLSGTPVVAIGALGTLMVMGGDNGGFMVKNDREEFASRVMELLGDPALHRQKSEDAKKHAAPWSIDELAVKLVSVYESSLADFRKEKGESRLPVWEKFVDKEWWKAGGRILRDKTVRGWKKITCKFGSRSQNGS